MDIKDVVSLYGKKSESQQVKFLSRLGHQITIYARDTYEVDGNSLTNPTQLRCINEIMHRVLGQQYNLLLGDKNRYADDIFIKMIYEMATQCKIENYFHLIVSDSFNG